MVVKGQQRFSAFDPRPTNYDISFPFTLAAPDNDDHVITSTPFRWQGESVVIKNELGSHKLQLFTLDGELAFGNVGYYDQANGQVSIRALDVETNPASSQIVIIKVSAVPANSSTIRPLRNYIIELDESVSTTRALIDEGTTKVKL